jgi:hypothetical protein
MNCPAKTEPIVGDGHNQNPSTLCPELTTRSDLGAIANARRKRGHRLSDPQDTVDNESIPMQPSDPPSNTMSVTDGAVDAGKQQEKEVVKQKHEERTQMTRTEPPSDPHFWNYLPAKAAKVFRTYLKFVGPGFMIAVVSPISDSLCTSISNVSSRRISIRATTQQTLQRERATNSSCCSSFFSPTSSPSSSSRSASI